MPGTTPSDFGFAVGDERPSVGAARVWALDEGAELWRFAERDASLFRRIEQLGELAGVIASGDDEAGLWLVREARGPSLSRWAKQQSLPLQWRAAVTIVADLAQQLSQLEADGLFPGPLTPGAVVRRGERFSLRLDDLVKSLVGSDYDGSGTAADRSMTPRWLPPEQADGGMWDNRGNRYVLGLIAYWLLSGEYAFEGSGLRRGLDEQRRRGAAPMPDAIATQLPPGLMAFCLRMLHADIDERPASAAEIESRLREFLDAGPQATSFEVETRQPRTEPADAPAAPVVPTKRRSAVPWRPLLAMAAACGGLALGWGATAGTAPKKEPAKRPIQPMQPLTASSTQSQDCARCHPGQVAEWKRSVMAHSVKSPLFQALEILIEEQVGRSRDCPNGAGVLRRADSRTACRDPQSGLPITGAGGEHWCVNCHSPGDNLSSVVPPWDAFGTRSTSRAPLRDLLPASTMEGISCAACHQVHGPVTPGNLSSNRYEGNPFWTSFVDGTRFTMRPEDRAGRPGIANSGYFLDVRELLLGASGTPVVPGGVHARPSESAKRYLRSSEFCGACHDVRLFGSDVIGVRKGEHFKRLRNAYSEWRAWSKTERADGRQPASCQDCHMSTFPGICVPVSEAPALPDSASALRRGCPEGTRFVAREPGGRIRGQVAVGSKPSDVSTHFFSGVDIPLAAEFLDSLTEEATLDAAGIPLGAAARRDLLLGSTFRFELDRPGRARGRLSIPVVIENTGAGHRVPAGFSQEREFWVHLEVTDATGRVVYEVGRIDKNDEDLRDKRFLRVNVRDDLLDGQGRPVGLFGADVADGVDVPRWQPPPHLGGTRFVGRGLINLQNGFLRCVVCIGRVDERGECQALPGQERARGDRFSDGDYDLDTGECRSNLLGENALFETYFPVGALDASRGVTRGPDAIIDRRSAAPGVPLRYEYDLPATGRPPFSVTARLMFRAFPPFLLKAFAAYERLKASQGLRPSGPLLTESVLARLEPVELHRLTSTIE